MTMPKTKTKRAYISSFRPCQLCNSPYRSQIEQTWKAGVPRKEIYDHFMSKTGHKSPLSLEAACYRHFAKKHYNEAKKHIPLNAPADSPHRMSTTNLNDLSQGLMDIGAGMVDFWKDNPLVARKELKIGEIMKAQDSVTNRMKVQVTQDALKLQMAKMFGGFLGDTIEGELVDEDPPTTLLE